MNKNNSSDSLSLEVYRDKSNSIITSRPKIFINEINKDKSRQKINLTQRKNEDFSSNTSRSRLQSVNETITLPDINSNSSKIENML